VNALGNISDVGMRVERSVGPDAGIAEYRPDDVFEISIVVGVPWRPRGQ
jgi:hypothetical protein